MAFEWFKEAVIGTDRQKAYASEWKDSAQSVTSCIMSELESHMKDVELYLFEQEREERRKCMKVDYSWLATTPRVQHYQIPQVERLQLEEMCSRIRPDECTRVLSGFHDVIDKDPPPPVEEMPQLLQCILRTTLESRPKASTPPPSSETVGEWISRRTRNSIAGISSRVLSFTSNNVRVEPFNDVQSGTSNSWVDSDQNPEMGLGRRCSENSASTRSPSIDTRNATVRNVQIPSSHSLSTLSVNELV